MLTGNSKKSVNVSLTKEVTREHVHAALDVLFKLHGCVGCGLVGIDVNLLGSPVEAKGLGNLAGVHSVEVQG